MLAAMADEPVGAARRSEWLLVGSGSAGKHPRPGSSTRSGPFWPRVDFASKEAKDAWFEVA